MITTRTPTTRTMLTAIGDLFLGPKINAVMQCPKIYLIAAYYSLNLTVLKRAKSINRWNWKQQHYCSTQNLRIKLHLRYFCSELHVLHHSIDISHMINEIKNRSIDSLGVSLFFEWCSLQKCCFSSVHTIGIGAQSTLGGHQIFAPKIYTKNQQNAQILKDSCLKNDQNTLIFMIFARKNLQNSRISHDFCRKNAQILH